MESKLGGRLLLSVVRTAHTPPTSFRTKKTMINDDTKRKSDAPSCCFLVFLARQFKKASPVLRGSNGDPTAHH